MRKLHRLRLLLLLDLRSSPTVLSTLLLFALSKPSHPHQKYPAVHRSGIPALKVLLNFYMLP